MKTKFFKSCARLFALFCVLTLAYTNAWGADFYAALKVSMSGAGGKIQVIQQGTGDITDLSKYTTSPMTCTVKAGREAEVTFDIGAVSASRGKKFGGWSALGGSGSPSFVTGSRTTAQASVKMKASSGSFGGLFGGTNTATITASFIDDPDQVTVTYLSASNGSYTAAGPDGYGTITIGNGSTYTTYSGDAITLNATPSAGYTFIRYYTVDEEGNIATLGELYKSNQIVSITGSGTISVCADFAMQPFAIGARTFETLDAALQAVKTTSSKTILVLKDVTVPAGRYTIPSGATLLIPRDKDQISPNLITDFAPTSATTQASSAYRTLTLADGANIIVNGAIEIGGKQGAGQQGANGAGIVTGSFGQLIMMQGSNITLNNGSALYAWGFVTGDIVHKDLQGNVPSGEIDARRGSKVYEQFQMYDWRGGTIASGLMDNKYDVFPVNTYFIQNVEVPTTYHPGSSLITVTSINVSGSLIVAKNIQIIGVYNRIDGKADDVAMFLMDDADTSDDTWVCKAYSSSNDRQMYSINSSARLGAISIELKGAPLIGDIKFNSKDYVLPITSNLKIHLLSGEMRITQSTEMLPGAEIEIDKTATVTINRGQSLYIYDSDQWGQYVFKDKYANQIGYAASHKGKPNKRTLTSSGLGDATINIHGTFNVEGALYTTDGGANIYSSISDAGTVSFSTEAAENGSVYQLNNYKTGTFWGVPYLDDYDHHEAPCTSAKLKNDAGSTYSDGDGFSETAGTAAGQSFCFIDIDSDGKGEWVNLTTDGCFVYDQNDVYYAKPADYVALKNGKTENADHTYSSADGSRTLILISGECQWWEVEYQEESGLYFCEKNGIYYYYDEEEEWIPKTFKITWQNWDGTTLKDEDGFSIIYEVPYGSTPKYNNSTPSRPDDPGYYTYDFTGWSPEFTPVTQDVIYIAQYERNPVMYTITWLNANGSEREVGYFQRDEIPVCRTQPADMSALEWDPAVSAVTGDATYQLHERNVDGPFEIKFLNWNGTPIDTQEVPKGIKPALPASTQVETKPNIDDVEFVFIGWNPEVVAATANTTYTAMFEEKPITYAITWQNWDGTELKKDDVTPHTVPQYTGTTPVREEDDDNAYVFNDWSPTIVAATTGATYTATYTTVPKDMEVGGGFGDRVLPGAVTTVTNMIVHSDGTLTVPNTATLKAANLILEATESTSGQVLVNPGYESRLQVAGTAYFDLTLNTPSRHWHAFGVPWRVDIDETPLKEVETGRTLTLGRDYDIIYYNGATRASQGPGAHCWEYVVDNGKTLSPGQGYMIAFASPVQTVRFTKAAGAPIIFNGSNSVTGGSGDDGGWNAIANPMAYHATLNAGPTVGYVHDGGEIGSDGYVPYDIDNKKYIVGKAVYVQASEDATVAVAAAGSKGVITPVAAPARRAKATDKAYLALEDYYRVSLADAAGVTGNVYVLNEEDKADQYIIGHDLSQFGMNATKPQIWVNRYGVKLALNTTAPIDGVAEFPISIYAPKDGEYTISLQPSAVSEQESETLYLTKDGEVIRNLSDGAYTTVLTKGIISGYGLRLGEKKAPEVATGFGEAVVDAHGKTTKVLIDGKVFIIREDRVYTIDGQLVK